LVDVANAAALSSAIDAAVAKHGRLDVVVCAAAVIDGGAPLWETPDEVLKELMDVDVLGVWNTAVAALPHLIGGPSPHEARFIAIASTAGHRGLFHLAAYSMAKHAVVGLVRGLQADLVATGVVAIAVSPGSTDTPMLEATGQIYGLNPSDFADHHSIRRLLSADDLAATVEFCCSPAAAALAGSVIHADGGFA
jgi:SDR family mycofactocin-dependent oxidoreductase